MAQKVKSLLQQRKALENDLKDEKEELAYLNDATKVNCDPIQRRRRHELERSIAELSKWLRSIDYSITEIQWKEGVSA